MSNFDNIEKIKEKLKQYQENSFISNDSKTIDNSVNNNEFDDSSKFKSEELTGGSFENYYNKKFEDSPYYIKIKEIIETIKTSGYKPIFDCDWEIIRNFYNHNEEFNNGKSEENYREDYIYYLDADGKFNKKVIVSEYYQFMSKRESKPNEVKYDSCTIDSILLETDYNAYRQKGSGNDVMIFTNMEMAMQYCDRDACSYAIRSKYKGEVLYKILCELYKKVLNTPQRINDIKIENEKKKQAEIKEIERLIKEDEKKREEVELKTRQETEKIRKEAEEKARKEAEQRQKEREIALYKMKKEKIEANFFKFVIIVPCCLYIIFLLFPNLFLNLVQINKKLEISLYVIPLIIALLCRVRYICDECVMQWYQTLLVICVSLILFLILNKKDVMGSSIFRWFASCFYSLFVLIIIGYHETKSYLFGFGVLFILHIAIVILAMTKYYIKFEYGWWIGIPAYVMIAISLFRKN